ncbi:MAG: sporulation protein YqfD [Negativicutes bacterium]|nr:sporulation protein YqfD [Negativicutes bacterium]
MLLLNILNYMAGAVKIRISGLIPEKFINLCIAQHIFLWGIKKDGQDLYAWLRLPDFFRIRPIVRTSETRVRVIRFFGLPFVLKKMKQRKMLVIGAVLCFATLSFLSSYIWFVDITGVKTISAEQVRAIAFEHGLKPGAAKSSVSAKALEKSIMLNIPEAAWVGVTYNGARAVIEVVERTLPKPEDKRPAHIVADKNGVVTEIIVLAGQPAVKKGDTIKKGDLLIKGFAPDSTTVPASPGAPQIITIPSQLIRANGIVRAQVWYESYGEAHMIKTWRQRTGQKRMAVALRVGGQQVWLKQLDPIPFNHYDQETIHKIMPGWRNSSFPVESTISIYHEVEILSTSLTFDEAREEAKTAALAAVQSQIPENAQILSRNIEVMKTNEADLVRIRVRIETIEDVGQLVPIQ